MKIDQFTKLFHTHPQLQDLKISARKHSFSKCSICQMYEGRIGKAARGRDPKEFLAAKEERRQHLLQMRCERVGILGLNLPLIPRTHLNRFCLA